jgi:hypothetical protein
MSVAAERMTSARCRNGFDVTNCDVRLTPTGAKGKFDLHDVRLRSDARDWVRGWTGNAPTSYESALIRYGSALTRSAKRNVASISATPVAPSS